MATFLSITSKQARFVAESIRDSAEQHRFALKEQVYYGLNENDWGKVA